LTEIYKILIKSYSRDLLNRSFFDYFALSDRDEIRWKFQVMIKNIEWVMDRSESERRSFVSSAEYTLSVMERQRNYRLAGIGFFITSIITLISTGHLDSVWVWTGGAAGIVAVALFAITERWIDKENTLKESISTTYYSIMKAKFIPLISMLSTYAMDEKISHQSVELVQSYVATYSKSVEYELSLKIFNALKNAVTRESRKTYDLSKFEHKNYKINYEHAKSELDDFQNANFSLGTEDIEYFIKEYEKNTKTKT